MSKHRFLAGLRIITALLLMAVVVLQAGATSAASDGEANREGFVVGGDGQLRVPGQVVVKFIPNLDSAALERLDVPDGLQDLFKWLGVKGVTALGSDTNSFMLRIGVTVDTALSILKDHNLVEWAEPNFVGSLADNPDVPNDPLYLDGKQWYLDRISAQQAWTITKGSTDIVVGVVDSGIDENHPDLTGKVRDRYDFYRERSYVIDEDGHGTEVSSFITTNTNNKEGLAGLNWYATLINVKAGARSLPFFDIARGIIFATNKGARVINGSFGGGFPASILTVAVAYASLKGVVQVYSSGNSGSIAPSYPAAYPFPGVIAVGASDINDKIVDFSSYGPHVSVVAPGAGVWGTQVGGKYGGTNGTSFSSPIVAGVAALVLSANPNLTNVQVKSILEGTADDISGGQGFNVKSGWGRVNAYKAVLAAKAGDVSPNKKSTLVGKVSGVDAKSVKITLDPFEYSLPLASDGSFKVTGLGKVAARLRATVQGQSQGVYEVNFSGQAGDDKVVNFAFANLPTTNGATKLVDLARNFDKLSSDAAKAIDGLYFADTGHTLGGTFLQYWQNHGGLEAFGYPISQPFTEISASDGKTYTVQYFQRNRFELHPENAGTPYEVLLGLLGLEQTAGRSFETELASGNGLYFPDTGHNLSGKFLQYWQTTGGLDLYGYPISGQLVEDGQTVQYFERNKMELHPENAGTKYEVLLGLLGLNLARQKNYL